jgi:anti-sigma regulatory factor (Ser/Thr protein kinase)
LKYFVAYCLFLFACVARGQQLSLAQYNTTQGLADPVVYRVMQDSKGLLWFSTDNGISRFDGTSFKNFSAKDALKASFIFTIIEKEDKLLLSTYGQGLQFFDGVRGLPGSYYNEQIKFPIDLLSFRGGLYITDKNKMYYLINERGVKKFNYPTHKKKNYSSKFIVHNDTLWSFHNGITNLNPATGEFEKYYTGTAFDSTLIYNGVMLPRGDFVLCTARGLICIDRKGAVRTLLASPFKNRGGNLLLLKNGCLLVEAPEGGLYLYDADLITRRLLITGITINDMLEDRDGNIWLCTYGKGVIKISNTDILSFSLDNVVNPQLFFDEATGQLSIFSPQPGNFLLAAAGGKLQLQRDERYQHITTAYRFGGQSMFVGSNSIYKISGGRSQLTAQVKQTISHISKDAGGQYWVGAKPGLYIGGSLSALQSAVPFEKEIVRSAVHTENGSHYIGTDEGLYLFRTENPAVAEKLPLPPGTQVAALCNQPGRDRLWIGTNNGLYSLEQHQLKKWISGLVVHKIIIDKNQHTWFATHLGLIGYNNRYFKLLNTDNGFQLNIRDLTYDAAADRLYALAPDKLLVAEAAALLAPNPAVVGQIYILQQRTEDTVLYPLGTSFSLPAGTGSITLEYAVPFFGSKQTYSLYYRMNGGAWVNTGWSNSINALNLEKGKNELELKLVDELNNTITVQKKITYFIPVPVWQRPWFIALFSILLTLLLLFAILKIRSFVQRKKSRMLKEKREKTELEHKVVSNMLNPHFMNNALNAIQSFVVRNDQRNTLNYLAKFGRLMRINLELLEKNSIPLAKELQNLSLYLDFEQLRNPGLLEYSVLVSEQIDTEKIMVPPLLLQPFAENAIWHGILPKGDPGHIVVSLHTGARQLEILIKDDGIGLAASQQAKKHAKLEKPSRGLQIMNDRFRLLNLDKNGYSFELYENVPQGACVRILIPL